MISIAIVALVAIVDIALIAIVTSVALVSIIAHRRGGKTFQWGGCSHDLSFGTKFRQQASTLEQFTLNYCFISHFSQEFVDAEEKDKIVLHNNEVRGYKI